MPAQPLTGPRLLVFADSLAFHGPTGPMPADDPRLWPNLAAARLGGQAHLFAGFGWTARDAWWALAGDPNIWALLPQVDALVLAVGSMDTLPSPLPTYLRTGLRYLRPDPLRRTVRKAYLAAQPVLSRLLRGRPVTLPPALTVRYLGDCLHAIRALRPDLPAVGVLPPTHRAPSYSAVHTGHGPATAAIRAWGARSDVPLLDLTALTGRHVLAGEGNPDGIHWGWAGHEAVATALVDVLGGRSWHAAAHANDDRSSNDAKPMSDNHPAQPAELGGPADRDEPNNLDRSADRDRPSGRIDA